jgi:hypothetical protein
MKPALALILLLISPAASSAQDAELRNRAVTLLERAHAVSLAPNLPNLERVDTFRVFDPSATVREGSFSRVVIQGVGRREETTFGDYHVVNIWTGRTLVTTEEKKELAPAEVDTVMHLTPIYLVRFDQGRACFTASSSTPSPEKKAGAMKFAWTRQTEHWHRRGSATTSSRMPNFSHLRAPFCPRKSRTRL